MTDAAPAPPARAAQPDSDPRPSGANGHLRRRMPGRAEQPGQLLRRDLDRRLVPLGPPTHHLRAHLAQRRGQPPHARLARIAADDGPDRLVRELDLVGLQPVQPQQPRQQVPGRNLPLLRLGVPGQLDRPHPFPQHRRHRTEVGRRRHEERLGQIERQVQVAVTERRARRRDDRLEQRRRRAARLVQTVDLVEHEHRIAYADAPQLLDDPPRPLPARAGHPRRGQVSVTGRSQRVSCGLSRRSRPAW